MIPSESSSTRRESPNIDSLHRSSSPFSVTSHHSNTPLRRIEPSELNNQSNDPISSPASGKLHRESLANLGLTIVGTGLRKKTSETTASVKSEPTIDSLDTSGSAKDKRSAQIDYEFLNFDQNEPPSDEIIESIFDKFLFRRAFTKEAKINLRKIPLSRKWVLICQDKSLVDRSTSTIKSQNTSASWFISILRRISTKDLHKLEKALRSKDFVEDFLELDGSLELLNVADPNLKNLDEERIFLIISCYKNIVNDKRGTDIIVQTPRIIEVLVETMLNSTRLINKKISTDILVLLSFWSPPLGRNNLLKVFSKVSKLNLFETWVQMLSQLTHEEEYLFTNSVLQEFFLSSLFLVISICDGAESINDKKIIHAKFKEAGIYPLFHKLKEFMNELIDEQIERYKSMERLTFANEVLKELNLSDSKADLLIKSIVNKAGINSELQDLNNEFLDLFVTMYESNSTAGASKILKLLNQIMKNILLAGSSLNYDNSDSVLNIAIQKLMDQLTSDDITRRAMTEVQQYEQKTLNLENEVKLLKESLNLSSGDILKQNDALQMEVEEKDRELGLLKAEFEELKIARKNEKQKWEAQNATISFNSVSVQKVSHSHNAASESLLRTLSKRERGKRSPVLQKGLDGSPSLSRTSSLSRKSSLSKSKSTMSLFALKNGLDNKYLTGPFRTDQVGTIDAIADTKSVSNVNAASTLSGSHIAVSSPCEPVDEDFNTVIPKVKNLGSDTSSDQTKSDTVRSNGCSSSASFHSGPPAPELPDFLKNLSVQSLNSTSSIVSNGTSTGNITKSSGQSSSTYSGSLSSETNPNVGNSISPPPAPPLPEMLQQRVVKSAPDVMESSETPISLPPPPPPVPSFLTEIRAKSAPSVPPPPPPIPDFLTEKKTESEPFAPPPPPPPLPEYLIKEADDKDDKASDISGPPPPPPLPKLLAYGPDKSAKKSKFKSLDSILTQNKINEISKSLHRPTKKLKQLHWEKVERVDNTLWSESSHSKSDELLELGIFQEVETLFTMRESKKVSPTSAVSKNEKKSFLARDLSQQFGINLHMFSSIPEEQLILKILKCDTDIMNNISVLEFFNKNELAEFSITLTRDLKPYSNDSLNGSKPQLDPSGLERADRLFLELCFNLRHYWRSRSRALLMVKTYEKDYYDLSKKVQILDDSIKSIKNSKNLKNLFILIREIGNFMNKKQVEGFKLTSLQKLNFIKDQNQNTFLQYLEKVIRRAYPEYLSFMDELSALQSSAKLSVEQLSLDIESYISTIKNVKSSMESGNLSDPKKLHPEDRVLTKVLPRLPEAERKYKLLEDQHNFIMADFDNLMKYFGENPSDSIGRVTFFAKFQEFIDDFKRVQKQNRENEEKIRIYEKRKEMMLNKKSRAQSRSSAGTDIDGDSPQEEDVVDNLLKRLKGVSADRRSSTAGSSRSRSVDQDDEKLLSRAQTLLEGTKKLS